jgi:FKBP-type peptidyl-prolyl cis-trans isomerase
VIPGWTEGMQLVGKGGMIELVIPSKLGYGPDGTPDGAIPPNAPLHFLVELLDVR